MLTLRSLTDGDGRTWNLEGSELRIGRGSDNDVVLSDFSVSRRHAALRNEGGTWYIHDLMSTNGVQVNRTTVKKAPMRVGDRLKVGIFEFEVEGDTAELAKATAVAGTPLPPLGASVQPSASLSSATIIRRLSDFSADYGLAPTRPGEKPKKLEGASSGSRAEKRKDLDQAYANRVFGFLTRLGRLLVRADDVDEVLSKVMDLAFEALPVDRGFILLRDGDEGEAVCELARFGERVEFRPQSEVPVSRTMLDSVMRERVALLTYDALADQRLAGGDSIRIHQIRAAMCTPLWSGERIIGVMQVDTPFHTGSFNEDDLDLFTAVANFAAVAIEGIRNADKLAVERQVRSRLERYHSPAVIEEVLRAQEGGIEGDEGVSRLRTADVTVLFADLVGFTPFTELSSPEQVAELLSGYFTHSVEAIFAEGGTLDKFIGDCVMAFFGAPVPLADHAVRAARAAARIQQSLAAWNLEREAAGQPPVVCRVALNSGPVVVGDVGSNRRVDYTVLGNTVNIAARLESSVAGPSEVVMGDETWGRLGGRFPGDALGERQLKGLQQRITAHRLRWREVEFE
jgi:adenylate cyclase